MKKQNLVVLFLIIFSLVQAQNNSTRILKEANDNYEQGYFNKVISLLEPGLSNKTFKESTQREKAYALLARTYIAMDYPKKNLVTFQLSEKQQADSHR